MTARARLLVLVIVALVLAGFSSLNGSVLALALLLLVYLGAGFLLAPGKLELAAERRLSQEQVGWGKPVEVEVAVQNRGNGLDEVFLVEDQELGLELLSGQRRLRLALPSGARVSLKYSLRARRGAFTFSGVRLVASDSFDLFRRVDLLPATGRLLVYPQVTRLRHIPIRPHQTHGFSGPLPANAGGSGVSFFDLREYQPGDAQRRINWRVSERYLDTLFTNEFEQERVTAIGLILDARQSSHVNLGGDSLFEHSVEATAALAETFLNEGHRVSLLTYGFGIERVYPGYGKATRNRILQVLARVQVGMNFALEKLDYLPTRLLPSHAQLIFISPVLDSGDTRAIARLGSYGYDLLLISPDPVEFEAQALAGQVEPAALRLARLERAFRLHQLYRAGIQVVDWPVHQSLGKVLQAALAHPARLPGRREIFR